MKYIDIDTFDKKARSGGVWVLYDGNEPDRILRRAIEPESGSRKASDSYEVYQGWRIPGNSQVTRERPVLIKRCHKTCRYFPGQKDGWN